MHRSMTRVSAAVTAGAAFTALGLTGGAAASAGITGAQAAKSQTLAVSGTQLWVSRYSGRGNSYDNADSMATAAGRVFVTGSSAGTAGNGDYATVAYSSATGARLWVKRYNGPANKSDDAAAVAVSPDGTKVFVTGRSQTSQPSPEAQDAYYSDYATVAYNAATGARLWVRRYSGPAGKEDEASSVSVARDGSTVFVTGSSQTTTSGSDYVTIAYSSAAGAQLWVKRYNGPGNGWDRAASVASPGDGKVYVTGSSFGGAGTKEDYATVAYRTLSGARLWVNRYNGPGNGWDQASSLAVSTDRSRVFVTGSSYSATNADYATVAYGAATGERLWVKRYNSSADSFDVASSVSVSPGGKVFITGASAGTTSSSDYATVAYSAASGAQQWVKRYNGPANSWDEATSIASPGNGKVYLTGLSTGLSTGEDYATIAYSIATGERLWVKRYNGPAKRTDDAYCVVASRDRTKVFITGTSDSGTVKRLDYATIAYRG